MYVFSQLGSCRYQFIRRAQGQVGMSCRLGGGRCGHGQHCQPEAIKTRGQGACSLWSAGSTGKQWLLAPHPEDVRAWWELWGSVECMDVWLQLQLREAGSYICLVTNITGK